MLERIVTRTPRGGRPERHRYDPASGLVLPVRVGVRGRFRWQTLDERGIPEIPRNPSGFAIGPIEGVEQPNLITNTGLDDMFVGETYAQSGGTIFGVRIASAGTLEQDGFRRFLHVGTSSVAPDVTDTTLGAEVQRASSSSGFADGLPVVYEYVSAEDLFRVTGTCTRVVQMTADRNLTEIGLSRVNNTTVSIRSLLLDEFGDPTTVSLLNEKFLRVDHTLIGEIPAVGTTEAFQILEYDAANNLVNTINLTVTYGPIAGGGAASAVEQCLRYGLNPRSLGGHSTISKVALRLTGATSYHPINTITTSNAGNPTFSHDAYATGSFERVFRTNYNAGQGNADWHGYMHGQSPAGGLLVCFDAGGPYTKQDTDAIQFVMKLTYGRA